MYRKNTKRTEKVKLPRFSRQFLINEFDINDPQWAKISKAQAQKIVTALTGYALTNVKAIEKAGLYSQALEGYKQSGGKLDIPKSSSRARAIMEIARLQKFLQSETATPKGIRALHREQDARIFGITKSGRPKRTMTEEQRRSYWAAYNEFRNGDEYKQYRFMNSNVVQQAIYSIGLDRRHYTAEDFSRLEKILPELQRQYEDTGKINLNELRLTSRYNWEDSANVFSGRRNRRKK